MLLVVVVVVGGGGMHEGQAHRWRPEPVVAVRRLAIEESRRNVRCRRLICQKRFVEESPAQP